MTQDKTEVTNVEQLLQRGFYRDADGVFYYTYGEAQWGAGAVRAIKVTGNDDDSDFPIFLKSPSELTVATREEICLVYHVLKRCILKHRDFLIKSHRKAMGESAAEMQHWGDIINDILGPCPK